MGQKEKGKVLNSVHPAENGIKQSLCPHLVSKYVMKIRLSLTTPHVTLHEFEG